MNTKILVYTKVMFGVEEVRRPLGMIFLSSSIYLDGVYLKEVSPDCGASLKSVKDVQLIWWIQSFSTLNLNFRAASFHGVMVIKARMLIIRSSCRYGYQ